MRRLKPNAFQTGFTIVEVMIVLVIAGMILLLVFGAIPALQRGSRNNARKQDVGLILQAVSHYELNDSGSFPYSCDVNALCTQADSSRSPNDNFLKDVANLLRYYDPTNISLTSQSLTGNPVAAAQGPLTAKTDTQLVKIYNYEKCDQNTQGAAVTTGAGYGDVVALYSVETVGGTPSPQCQQL